MKIVKISAIWCGGCLVMNKVWKQLKELYDFDFVELDYDMDEEKVSKYDPGNILPVFIFFDGDKEIDRIHGEFSLEEIKKKIEEVGVMIEKN